MYLTVVLEVEVLFKRIVTSLLFWTMPSTTKAYKHTNIHTSFGHTWRFDRIALYCLLHGVRAMISPAGRLSSKSLKSLVSSRKIFVIILDPSTEGLGTFEFSFIAAELDRLPQPWNSFPIHLLTPQHQTGLTSHSLLPQIVAIKSWTRGSKHYALHILFTHHTNPNSTTVNAATTSIHYINFNSDSDWHRRQCKYWKWEEQIVK